jgi:Sulfotransferase domain
MSEPDGNAPKQAPAASARRRVQRAERKVVYLVSYPRSGNTLVREYFAILQGRAQGSIYAGDVVQAIAPPLTHALDHIEIIKSHRIPPADGSPMIYLVRDGRNAALSFLYMAFLFGGHQYTELSEVFQGISWLDATEGSWADHVTKAMRQSEARKALFVRFEDVVSDPEAALTRMIRFTKANVPAAVMSECVRRHQNSSEYTKTRTMVISTSPRRDRYTISSSGTDAATIGAIFLTAAAGAIFTTAARPPCCCISGTSAPRTGGATDALGAIAINI